MNDLTEDQERVLGAKLVEVFDLEPIYENGKPKHNPVRYMLGAGYHTKTVLGIARVVLGLIEESKK